MISIQLSTFVSILRVTIQSSERMIWYKFSPSFHVKVLRISELDEETQTYTMSAYLIAQLGKNFANGVDKRITGEELLEAAWNKIEEMQYQAGGVVTFLEANNEDKLLDFYKDNRFQKFDTRQTVSNNAEPHELVQLLRLL